MSRTPGSALLFPSLCHAVGGMPTPETDPPADKYCADRTAMMPKRRRTRTQDRAYRVATERRAQPRRPTSRPTRTRPTRRRTTSLLIWPTGPSTLGSISSLS